VLDGVRSAALQGSPQTAIALIATGATQPLAPEGEDTMASSGNFQDPVGWTGI